MFFSIFKKIEEKGMFPNLFYKANAILNENQTSTTENKKMTGQYLSEEH